MSHNGKFELKQQASGCGESERVYRMGHAEPHFQFVRCEGTTIFV